MSEEQINSAARAKTVTLIKREGETPLECLERFRQEVPLYKDAVLSYAGRLDPMAQGALLVLVDEENKKREQYLNLNKVYEVDILFGVSTDTGDVLGVVNTSSVFSLPESEEVTPILKSFVGKFKQKYPLYSSKPVQGKPLFMWAREGRIDEIEVPEKDVEIFSIDLLESYALKSEDILESVIERIGKIHGDFRQKEILEQWHEFFARQKNGSFNLVKIKVTCSSGTYMRSLAENIAKKLGTSGIAWKIKRLEYITR